MRGAACAHRLARHSSNVSARSLSGFAGRGENLAALGHPWPAQHLGSCPAEICAAQTDLQPVPGKVRQAPSQRRRSVIVEHAQYEGVNPPRIGTGDAEVEIAQARSEEHTSE